MTQAAFYDDPYRKSMDTTVVAVDGAWVVLDASIFYPEGGGQPGDSGELSHADGRCWPVLDTRKGEGGVIRLQLGGETPPPAAGDAVTQHLNWARRHRHMRMHTCMHLLCSLVPQGVTGGALTADKGRLDFDLSDGEPVPDKTALTEALNGLIRAATPVTVESVSEAELDANPEMVRTMSVQPPRGRGTVRIIHVEGIDRQPCGGTHVTNTAEIGEVVVRKIENKGKRNRRIILGFAEEDAS